MPVELENPDNPRGVGKEPGQYPLDPAHVPLPEHLPRRGHEEIPHQLAQIRGPTGNLMERRPDHAQPHRTWLVGKKAVNPAIARVYWQPTLEPHPFLSTV